MCYVCNCFSWTLDLMQRGLTFILTCWLATTICCGFIIASLTGIAYGYNYSLAEFITLTRSDVNVYMKRGQFYDKANFVKPPKRRIGEDDDIFPFNLSDYQQEVPLGDDSLSEKWVKDEDTRKYAEKLTKYSEQPLPPYTEPSHDVPERTSYYQLPTQPLRRASIKPSGIVPTTVMKNGFSEIIMRRFQPIPNIVPDVNHNDIKNDDEDDQLREADNKILLKATNDVKERATLPPNIRTREENSPTRSSFIMRHWGTTDGPFKIDDIPEVDEDAVVYRAA